MSQMNSRSLVTLPLHAWFGFVPLVSTALLVCLLASATTVQAQQPSVWSAIGSLSLGTGSYHHTATLLANGKVLVVGGIREVVAGTSPIYATTVGGNRVFVAGTSPIYATTGTADLYDPATDRWSATGSLNTPRSDHIAVRLDNGKVLVAGGHGEWTSTATCGNSSSPCSLTTVLTGAEIYDPDTGTWSASGNLNLPRRGHLATLLTDGRVLVTGGSDSVFSGAVNTAELYDPTTGTWSASGNLNLPRRGHLATLLTDGRVLVTGGSDSVFSGAVNTAELYDPTTGVWKPAGTMNSSRRLHTATLLHNGKVLVAGGVNTGVRSAELYDPATGSWTATDDLIITERGAHTATLLHNGKVLVAGGVGPVGLDYDSLSSAELYDPVTASWSVTGSLNTAHHSHTATTLANGKVLVYGGSPVAGNNSAELYAPGFEIPMLTLNSTSFCIGGPWSSLVIDSAGSESVQLLGVSNGTAWEIARWGVTDQGGSFRANGTMASGTEGTHTLSVEISGIRSNAFSFAVSQCKP